MKALSSLDWATCPCALLLILAASGCHSSSYSQRRSTPVASAAPLGTSLDDIDARNRADIAAQLGRPVAPGPATPQEVVAMSRAGIDSRFIVSYINRSVEMRPVDAQDVIYMHDQGVNEQVIQAMLTPGSACSRAEIARAMPPRVLILEDPWWPYYYPRYGFIYGGGCRSY
jgi:hypothetical protein